MDLSEARKILWIRPNRRSVGELLDEGRISKGQLEWAAANAYNPELQKAAKILLFNIEKTNIAPNIDNKTDQTELPKLEIPISVDQARATIWPFKPFKGEPMGSLADEKKISLKELGNAIENAWDQKVRNAALVLSAIRMNQIVKEPPPPKGHISVYSKGKSFTTRKELQIVQARGLILGLVLGAALFWLYIMIFGRRQAESSLTIGEILSSPNGILALIIVFAILIGAMILLLFTVNQTINDLDDLADLYRKGAEGEERVADQIKRSLNDDWSLFRNITISGQRGGDMDAVLVGPTGVWILEIKTLSGKFKNIGEMWQCLNGKKWEQISSVQNRNG